MVILKTLSLRGLFKTMLLWSAALVNILNENARNARRGGAWL